MTVNPFEEYGYLYDCRWPCCVNKCVDAHSVCRVHYEMLPDKLRFQLLFPGRVDIWDDLQIEIELHAFQVDRWGIMLRLNEALRNNFRARNAT